MIGRRQFVIASSAIAGLATVAPRSSTVRTERVKVVAQRVDYIDRPLGLENPSPRLSWRLESDARNVRQSAYRILVASSEEALKAGQGDLWDSGRVNSSKSFGIKYQGVQLASRQRCWWCVQVWDEHGVGSPPSAISWWEMGLLNTADWTAQWLAVEDPLIEADRKVGLHWIWGSAANEVISRKFRLKVHLAAPSESGQLLATVNDWIANGPFSEQLTRVWIDGTCVTAATSAGPPGQWVKLERISAGEHLIAVEVKPIPLASFVSKDTRVDGLVVFARLNLENGETLRIKSGPDWKTSLTSDADWFTPHYDDSEWEAARPSPIEAYQPWPPLPAIYLRRKFHLDKPVLKARLYATALGAYEARLNGLRVGDALLTPEISQYAKRVLYRVYDVTTMLVTGANALGMVVGDGWYGSFDGLFAWGPPPRRALAQLELTFMDGSRQVIASGPEWRTMESPIQVSEIRVGEIYDARLEQPGWDTAESDDSHWQPAEVAEIPSCRPIAQISPPIRVTETIKPRSITQPKPGVYVFDFGQNFAGWSRLHVKGDRGTSIELKYAELLAPSGEVDQPLSNIGAPKRDVYILRGDVSGETFEPHFTYRGFRYVQLHAVPSVPTYELEGLFVHSDLDMTSQLRIDDPRIQQIWRNTVRSQRSNFVGIPTDCPSREQRGFMGDAGFFWDAAAFNMDVCAFTSRQMDNVVDDQSADGAFPQLAPASLRERMSSYYTNGTAPAWGEGGIILPWTAWRRYGDLDLIERLWRPMNRHLQFILDNNPDYVWRNKRGLDFGDWLAVGQVSFDSNLTTPKDLIGTAYWAHSADLLAQMGHALGRTDEAHRLRTLFNRVRHAFNETFVRPDGVVGNGSQTSYVLALQFRLLPESTRKAAVARLATDIRRRGVSLTTGMVGTPFILDVLADSGLADLAYGLLLKSDYPSWGYMIRNGATTMWENWSGELQDDKTVTKLSRNHYALGAICGFLFRRVAGIDTAEPGFETIAVRPVLDARVKRGGGHYDSIMGRISTDWAQLSEGRLTLEVTIPPNAQAHIHLPAQRHSRIEEGGVEVLRRTDMRITARLDHEVVIDVGAGTYQFLVTGSSHSGRN